MPCRVLVAVLLLGLLGVVAGAEDWPTYQHDAARTGVTRETLPWPLTTHWVARPPAPPRPAWPASQPNVEHPKVKFDDAFYTIANADTVFYGSSVDHQVYALVAATGEVRWRFYTEAPIRLAPTLAGDQVLVGSDDGRVYCLAARDGQLRWRHEAAPSPRRVLGHGQVISLWPVRTGVVVHGERASFGAGIFPHHEPQLVSVDLATGTARPWADRKDKAWLGLSPQGYLLATADSLIVSNGRSMPAVLDPLSGNPRYRMAAPATRKYPGGGDYSLVLGQTLFHGTQNALYPYDLATGTALPALVPALKLLAADDAWYILSTGALPGVRLSPVQVAAQAATVGIMALPRAPGERTPPADLAAITAPLWRFPLTQVLSLVLAGQQLIVGTAEEVLALDRLTGEPRWRAPIPSGAAGLTVAHGRLLVSARDGRIHCFASGPAPAAPPTPEPPADPVSPTLAAQALVLKAHLPSPRGFALVLGSGSPAWAIALARQTELQLTCLVPTAELAAARELIHASGLYGHRVTVNSPGAESWPYPDYAANLVLQLGPFADPALASRELARVLKPCGGRLVLAPGPAGEAAGLALPAELGHWTTPITVPPDNASWATFTRGQLPGSGWWTHYLAGPGNTGASPDQAVRDPLGVLWFGEPGPGEMVERHQRPMSPLVLDGRVFCQGWSYARQSHTLICFDAYNGTRYWERAMPGAIRLGFPGVAGNLAVAGDSLFVVTDSRCHRLAVSTGETRAIYQTPANADGTHPTWSVVAVLGERLLGATTSRDYAPDSYDKRRDQTFGSSNSGARFSNTLFAIDLTSGALAWSYPGAEIRDSTIALSAGRVYFAENRGPPTGPPAIPQPLAKTAPAPAGAPAVDRLGQPVAVAPRPPLRRIVQARHLSTGERIWEHEVDLTDCGRWEPSSPAMREAAGWAELQALATDELLIFAGAYHQHDGVAPDAAQRRALALATSDGHQVWSQAVGNLNRPIVVRDHFLAGNVLRDLSTGLPRTRPDAKTGAPAPWAIVHGGACGTPSACDSMVFFRKGGTGWRNLADGSLGQFLGMRPGCFINIIPAGGVVVQPEASSGCICAYGYSFSMQCTLVLRPLP